MRWLHVLRMRIRSLFQPNLVEDELREEFEYHLSRRIEENVARGLTQGEARRQALLAMQGTEQQKEICRDLRRTGFWDMLRQDVSYALRGLRRRPGFTVVALSSLALGIGFNTAVFGFLNTLILAKLPVQDPDHLYQLTVTHRTVTHNRFSYPDYQKLRANFDIIDGIAVWGTQDFNLETGNGLRDAHGAYVSGEFFRVLGVKPVVGRLLQDEDDSPAGSAVAVLGYGFWQRAYAGDATVIGRTFPMQGHQFTIVGVMPRGFDGAEVSHPRDVILPLHALGMMGAQSASLLTSQGAYWLKTLLRLKPGVTMEAAGPVLRERWPAIQLGRAPLPGAFTQRLDIQPGGRGISQIRDDFSQALIVLMVLVSAVLLIACANIANLLMARATARRKEMAVRLAMGASRGRLIRQALTESLVLATLGAALGIGLASWISNGLLLFLPEAESGFLAFEASMRTLLFTGLAAVTTALLFGLLPAFQATRVPLLAVVNETTRGAGGGRRTWASRAVVAVQVAVCLVLVTGALLFARSLNNTLNINLGMNLDGLYTAAANTYTLRLPQERTDALMLEGLDRLATLPGVAAVSAQRSLPLSGGAWWNSPRVPGYTPPAGDRNVVYMNGVAPDYFKTMGTRLLAGREFTDRDNKGTGFVAIVSQAFVRRYYASSAQDAIGKSFKLNDDAGPIDLDLEIVGVVEDTKYQDVREASKELVFFALFQSRGPVNASYVVRLASGVDAQAVAGAIRTTLSELAPGATVGIRPYRLLVDDMTRRDRMIAILSGAFGLLGVVLSCIGLYGIMAQAAAARTGEIGIRLTLGASRSQVEWLVLREALTLVAAGLAIGVPAAIASGLLAKGLLYGMTPSDPIATAGAVLLMLAVTAVAAWIPVRRASRLDPMVALRHD